MSNTPDFILAQFLVGCLSSFDMAVSRRDGWYGRGRISPASPEGSESQPSLDTVSMVARLTEADKLLRTWAGFAKVCGLAERRDGNLADYDDELASAILDAARKTIAWRDGEPS